MPWQRGDGGDAGAAGPELRPAAYAGSDLTLATSCDDLLRWYVEHGVDRIGPYGWTYGYGYGMLADSAVSAASEAGSDSAQRDLAAAAPAPVRSTSEATGTNVQEAGVDEPDVVKTDGTTLFRIEDGDLVTYDLTGSDVVRLSAVELPRARGADSTELLLSGDTVVVLSHHDGRGGGYVIEGDGPVDADADPASTEVVSLDVSDPAAPVVTHTVEYDAALVTARLHGGVVRIVLEAALPALDFTLPDRHTTDYEATQANRAAVRTSEIGDWLPTFAVDGGPAEQLFDCDQVAVPDEDAGLGTIAVVGFDAATPDTTSATGLAVDSELAYASTDQLYLATSPSYDVMDRCFDCFEPVPPRGWGRLLPSWVPRPSGASDAWDKQTDDGTSHLYAFDLDGIDTTFVAAGEVDGVIRDRWSMDAADGTLRVAVGPSWRTGTGNSVVTFRQEGNDLVEAGRLDGLGVGEDIQSVRWFDTLAIVVTFRQVDPLYAIDLTDPDQPVLLGELKIPGFSAYLHPLGEHRLLGLGEGPGAADAWGAQAALFDVTDLAQPRQLDVVSYGPGTQALATIDPRQLTWLPDGRTVLSVVSDYNRRGPVGYVSVLTLGGGRLDNRMVPVEHSNDVAAIRLVPLADGRVVLVTAKSAAFLVP
ncbi:MAG TPA: hypothetical protein DEQ43_04345 [Nocardioides bacterium]|nr:hypothetical protein [Nocardioides sp.]HRD62105.1 beta-propeller domain-containing protein [Nocardioides sp.]